MNPVIALPPGPKSSPTIQTLRWAMKPDVFMEGYRKQFGDAFTLHFLGNDQPHVMVSNPDVNHAIIANKDNGLPSWRAKLIKPFAGPTSMFLLEGAEHLAMRRTLLPAFHGDHVATYEEVIREQIVSDIQGWPTDEPFALHPRMQQVTLEVIMIAIFGLSDDRRRVEFAALLVRLLKLQGSTPRILVSLLATRLGRRGPHSETDEVLDQIKTFLTDEITKRRAASDITERDDLLSMLLLADSKSDDSGKLDDAAVRDQLITLLFAGHETTANTIAWTIELLLQNPVVLKRLMDEIDGDGDDTSYLGAVIEESMRLRPVSPLIGRRLAEDLHTDSLSLPAGTDVVISTWLTHTRPDIYPQPYEFRPERFIDNRHDTYAWLGFGGGIRRCPGAPFADLELRVTLTEILKRRVLQLAGSKPERVALGTFGLTLAPRYGVMVSASPRS